MVSETLPLTLLRTVILVLNLTSLLFLLKANRVPEAFLLTVFGIPLLLLSYSNQSQDILTGENMANSAIWISYNCLPVLVPTARLSGQRH